MMKQWEKARVILLPTNDHATKFRDVITLCVGEEYAGKLKAPINHHLYIITHNQINEGDLCIQYYYGKYSVIRCDAQNKSVINNETDNLYAKKIIATTDPSLSNKSELPLAECNSYVILPKLHKTWLNYFINEYNKGNIITDILVEYELIPFSSVAPDRERGNRLKINSDNTITIKQIKENWNRVEVVKLLKELDSKIKNSIEKPDGIIALSRFNTTKWIKENL